MNEVVFPLKRLDRCADLTFSGVDKVIHQHEEPVRLCNYMDAYSNHYLTSSIEYSTGSATRDEIKRCGLQEDDVVITKDSETPDDIGVAAVVTEPIERLVCGYHLAILRPHESETSGQYLKHAIESAFVKRQFSNKANGSTRYGLTKGAIGSVQVPVPDIQSQRTIARILGTVDGLIERTEALIAKQQQIKQGLLHDLFTRGVDAHGALRPTYSEAPELYHETALGWLPKGWRVERLGNVTSVRGRVGWKGYTVHDLRDSGPLVLGAAQISKDNRLKLDEPVYLSMEKYQESPEIMVQEGDLLIVQRGSIGKVVMVDEPIGAATINPSMILLKVGGIDATFLYHWLCSPALQDQIVNATSSTGVPMISQTQAGAFKVPLPNPDEQRLIAERLAIIMNRIRIEEKEAAKLRLLKSGLMQDLLTGRVSVDQMLGRAEDQRMELQGHRS
jgi:type I restriction enzyme S subunit